MTDAVLFDARDDGIAIITINRPDSRNALSREVRAGLFAAWDRFERSPDLRVAILTGAGDKAFCAGGNLKEMMEDGMAVPPRDFFPLPGDTIELSKPTIAAVNGIAFAGGWMIAQACDLCVASSEARFAITEVKVGRSSPWATPLIHMIPQRIMAELILTGRPITAQRAYEIRAGEPAGRAGTGHRRGDCPGARDPRRRAAIGSGWAGDGPAGDRDGAFRGADRRATCLGDGVPQRGWAGGTARVRREAPAGVEGSLEP